MSKNDSQVVDLNVGGRHLTTSLSTLAKYPDSMLAAMLSGRHPVAKDKDGRYFIDVDGDVFVHILNFLRFGKMPPPERASEALRDNWKRGIAGYDDCLNQLLEGLMASRYHSGVLYIQFSDSSQYVFTLCKVAGIPEGHQVINVKYTSSTTYGTNLVHFLNEDLKRIGVHLQPGDFRPEPKCGCRVALRYMIKLE
ncbi:FH protein interacting protein FIP2-like [Haliotis rufescens]|uniref:FH protein interacting protein FIP2-like n=1 Tax=Haliotis rufescens TaxID=6454 RepID=UPI00201EA1FE|nr:FH protein interacting protein FIP2-like [Haliotis rufescens]